MKRIVIAAVATLIASTAAAQIVECVDAKGNREYAQSCRAGTVKETPVSKGGASAPSKASTPTPATKSLAERDAEFRKRNMEKQESDAKAEKEQVSSKVTQQNCLGARANLKALQDGQRISKTNPTTGERYFLEDNARAGEIASAQKAVDGWCK